ncbi:hypothetical protein KUTeg_017943 [Tegillarca granosa]|uniref:Major facilitator superfamily domain-containing protein 12-like n=1 Tax=Tegillarca granosa TaxID=220873 RepID=A0ABQ9ELD0_TEGGR|nr:hypothetical protein KUTeg_017943 [Tegillarca granosa]
MYARNMETKSIPLPKKFGYSIGHCLNDLTGALWFSYLITYFHEVKHFDDLLAGYLMLIGQVADAVFTPLIGHTSDKYDGCCFGKRKSWYMIGVCCIIISFPFIFIECLHCSEVPDWAQFIFYVPLVILFQFGWAAVQISHLSLIPEMTQCLTERDSVAIVPLVVYASGFFTSLLMRFINKRLGRKRTYAFGQLCTIGACVWIYFITNNSAYQIYGASAFIGIGGSTVLVTSLAMTSDLIGNNTTSAAFVYGAMSFTDKLSNGIAVVLIQRLNTCRIKGFLPRYIASVNVFLYYYMRMYVDPAY